MIYVWPWCDLRRYYSYFSSVPRPNGSSGGHTRNDSAEFFFQSFLPDTIVRNFGIGMAKLQASLSGPFSLTRPDLVTSRKGNHPVLRASVLRNRDLSTACDLSRLFFSFTGVRNSLSEFCVQHCFKFSANRWLEISWFSHTARVFWRSAVAFGKQVLGERSSAHLIA